MFGLKFRKNLPCQKGKASSMRVKNLQSHCEIDIGMERQVSVSASSSQEVEMEILCKWTGNSTPTGWNEKIRVQYVAPGPDEKDANVYFLPQKNSSELKFVLQFTVTFP